MPIHRDVEEWLGVTGPFCACQERQGQHNWTWVVPLAVGPGHSLNVSDTSCWWLGTATRAVQSHCKHWVNRLTPLGQGLFYPFTLTFWEEIRWLILCVCVCVCVARYQKTEVEQFHTKEFHEVDSEWSLNSYALGSLKDTGCVWLLEWRPCSFFTKRRERDSGNSSFCLWKQNLQVMGKSMKERSRGQSLYHFYGGIWSFGAAVTFLALVETESSWLLN